MSAIAYRTVATLALILALVAWFLERDATGFLIVAGCLTLLAQRAREQGR